MLKTTFNEKYLQKSPSATQLLFIHWIQIIFRQCKNESSRYSQRTQNPPNRSHFPKKTERVCSAPGIIQKCTKKAATSQDSDDSTNTWYPNLNSNRKNIWIQKHGMYRTLVKWNLGFPHYQQSTSNKFPSLPARWRRQVRIARYSIQFR